MPKQALTINDFSGGLTTDISPRDLEGNQLEVCTNLDPSRKGRLKATNAFSDDDTNFGDMNLSPATATEGYGLFLFSNDRDVSNTSNANSDEFLVSSDLTSIDIQELEGSSPYTISQDVFTASSNPVAVKPSFYTAEGDLFIGGTDAVGTTFATPRSYVHHRQKKHDRDQSANGSWAIGTQAKTAPTENGDAGDMQVRASGANATAGYTALGANELDWVVEFGIPDSGSWNNDATSTDEYLEFGGSWLYKNKAESQITTLANGTTFDFTEGANCTIANTDATVTMTGGTDTTKLAVGMSVVHANIPAGAYILSITDSTHFELSANASGSGSNQTLTFNSSAVNTSLTVHAYFGGDFTSASDHVYGARLYSRRIGENVWYLLAEADFASIKGVKGDLETNYLVTWRNATANYGHALSATQVEATTGAILDPPSLLTFKHLNGYDYNDQPTSGLAYFKHAVVANSRTYIGNVKINGQVYGDRILKSAIGVDSEGVTNFQFDVFTEGSYLDVAINDGDEITALAAYADRILEFKRRSLYIINVSKEMEFIEDVRMGAGVHRPGAITETPFGIVWANTTGCFLYDGEKISQLQMGKISNSDWENVSATTASGVTEYAIVGYDPINRQIIVLWDGRPTGASDNDGQAYVYTLDTQSWHYVPDIIDQQFGVSNMITTSNGELIIKGGSANNEISKYAVRGTTSAIDMRTGQLSLGNPAIKKNLTNVTVRYKYGGSNLVVSIITNDNDPSRSGDDIGEVTTNLSGNLTDTSGNMHTKEYSTVGTVALQGQHWFQVKIAGNNAHQLFELDEIVLTYRELGVR